MDVGFLCIDEVGEEVHLVAFVGERERGHATETHKGGGATVKSRRELSVRRARARAWESVRRFRKSVRKGNVRMFDDEWCRRERHTSSECQEA